MGGKEYGFEPVSSISEYWYKYWRHRVRAIENADRFGCSIQSPRFLLESIVFEISHEKAMNPLLSDYFKSELGKWQKQGTFKSLYGKQCALALRRWNDKPILVSTICKSILHRMDNGEYYRAILNNLVSALCNAEPYSVENRKQIHLYTDILIAEFISKGYCLEDIESMIYHPQVMMAASFDVIIADEEVCGINRYDYTTKEEYHAALTEYFKGLSIKERVEILNIYYEKDAINAFVLIRLKGIKGKIDAFFDGINLYSLDDSENSKRYIKSLSTDNNIEKSNSDIIFVNAAIPVKHKGNNSSIQYAIIKLRSVLAPIQVWMGIDTPIAYSEKNITIVENEQEIFVKHLELEGSSMTRYAETIERNSYHDITDECDTIHQLSQDLQTLQTLSKSHYLKLGNAAKWIQNAKNATNYSDKLIFSWFAIECLIKLPESYKQTIVEDSKNGILDFVHSIVSSIVVRNRYYHYRNEIFDSIYWNFERGDNRYNLPNDIREILIDSKKVEYAMIFEKIPVVISSTTNERLIDELVPFMEFYNKSGKGLMKFRHSIKNELTYIYCLRNHIVHNATVIDNQLKYYSNRSLYYANSLFNAILSVSTSNHLNVEDAIIKISADCEIFFGEVDSLLKKYNLS
jgi:hypothetical protein